MHSPSILHSQMHAQKTALPWNPRLLHRNHRYHRATASTLAADHLHEAQNMERMSPAALLHFGASLLLLVGLSSGNRGQRGSKREAITFNSWFSQWHEDVLQLLYCPYHRSCHSEEDARGKEREQALVLALSSCRRCMLDCSHNLMSTPVASTHTLARPQRAAATTDHREGAPEGTNRVGTVFSVHP